MTKLIKEGGLVDITYLQNAVAKGADFYNWNIIKVRYCDGSSFTGDVEAVDPGSAKNLPKSCTSERKPELCLFPQYVIQHVQTPIYIINSPYDQWQVMNILVPGTADPHGNWLPCKQDVRNCSSDQIETMQQFRSKFLDALGGLLEKNSESNGMFIDSCYEHCHIDKQETWFRNDSTVVSNKKLADEVGDWFYDDKYQPLQKPDCPYPFCLDGSPPAYHFHKGFGTGIDSWLVYHEGGAWCNNVTTCLSRKNTELGSSKYMAKQFNFTGILSNQQELNPYFYNWNIIRIRYCDGASFTGDVKAIDPGSAKNLPKSCTSKRRPELCFFPQYVIQDVRTPIFIINAAYDLWQVSNILVPEIADPHGFWKICKANIRNCSSDQIKTMQHSCYVHCQTERQEIWFRNDSTLVWSKKLANEIRDWFYYDEDRPLQKADCPYPCNPTCYHNVFNITTAIQ
ncbi:hypothetical protein FEM48_Zijuj11G0150300 [Ziziphus jujuba var. spinosa]|uniref:Pectin acetylesterase n=1 Tax=Ziziphus jujuba var. spinosa TaxID=714518 RepID=A0A978UJM3_ZIZJJ|nr:hypothetical protein FEM48_Zijuj11G0150300 [Ziziphus jujuba var. spinosa]